MIASFFHHVFSALWTTLTLAGIGAGIGAGSMLVGRLVGGLQAYLVAAAIGAIIMVATYGTGALNSRDTYRLEQEKAQLQYELNALGEVRLHEQVQETERTRLDVERDKRLDDALKIIETHEKSGGKDCPIGAFRDELDAIRSMK